MNANRSRIMNIIKYLFICAGHFYGGLFETGGADVDELFFTKGGDIGNVGRTEREAKLYTCLLGEIYISFLR